MDTRPVGISVSLVIRQTFAHLVSCSTVAVRACTVSFTGPSGVCHSVDVTAESVYEAAALGLSRLRSDEWADQIAPGTPIEITVREPATTHTVSLDKFAAGATV